MYNRNKILALAILMCLPLGLLVSMPVQNTSLETKTTFALAYDFDTTKNGNYIAYISLFVDGVLNGTLYRNPISYDTPADPFREVPAGANLTLSMECWINGTFLNIASLSEGLNLIRHSVTVYSLGNNTILFSQQNFTYISGLDAFAPMYIYKHQVILDFVPEIGVNYRTTITYEVYY